MVPYFLKFFCFHLYKHVTVLTSDAFESFHSLKDDRPFLGKRFHTADHQNLVKSMSSYTLNPVQREDSTISDKVMVGYKRVLTLTN